MRFALIARALTLALTFALTVAVRAAPAQVVDSLVQYCPPERLGPESPGDTVVVLPRTYSLSVGQSVYLRAIQCGHLKVREVSRVYGVKWASSDTTVLKVTRTTGRVTARRPGTATITATYP